MKFETRKKILQQKLSTCWKKFAQERVAKRYQQNGDYGEGLASDCEGVPGDWEYEENNLFDDEVSHEECSIRNEKVNTTCELNEENLCNCTHEDTLSSCDEIRSERAFYEYRVDASSVTPTCPPSDPDTKRNDGHGKPDTCDKLSIPSTTRMKKYVHEKVNRIRQIILPRKGNLRQDSNVILPSPSNRLERNLQCMRTNSNPIIITNIQAVQQGRIMERNTSRGQSKQWYKRILGTWKQKEQNEQNEIDEESDNIIFGESSAYGRSIASEKDNDESKCTWVGTNMEPSCEKEIVSIHEVGQSTISSSYSQTMNFTQYCKKQLQGGTR